MKIIIHGGFFSESTTNSETKIAKQEALLRIVKDSYAFLKKFQWHYSPAQIYSSGVACSGWVSLKHKRAVYLYTGS